MDRKTELTNFWLKKGSTDELALCISGSVARKEATTYSDMDILIVTTNSSEAKNRLQSIVPALHTEFAQISVVARTVEDCVDIRQRDFRSWLSLFDSVFIAGASHLYDSLWVEVRKDCLSNFIQIYEQMKRLTKERHTQYGASTALLEPNIKNSAGSLRDIQTICYLEKISAMLKGENDILHSNNAAHIIEQSSLLPFRRAALKEAWFFLLATRLRIHELKGHLHDTLEFECQPAVANPDSDDTEGARLMVEAFMKQYYSHSRTVYLSLELSFFDHAPEYTSTRLLREELQINLPANGLHSPEAVLSLFVRSAREGKRLGSDVIRYMSIAAKMDFTTKECASLFDILLRQSANVGATIRCMHEYGILKLVFPEFEMIEHFFQHNIYHYYTVDEHTIKAIEAVENLRADQSMFGEIFRSITDTSVLYYAILLHDIAKPIDIGSHELLGARLVPEILSRYGRPDAIEVVTFLVRHHLQMEQTAFRRDLRDPAAIRSFSDILIGGESLELLLLLTFADMSALNPGILTEWKKVLLIELFHTARKGNTDTVALQSRDVSPLDYGGMGGLSDADCHRAMEDVREGEPVKMYVFQRRGFTEIVIFCLDRSLLLSRLAAALLSADVAVVHASIDTQLDVAIDIFRVTDIVRHGRIDASQIARLREMVLNVCTAEVEAEDMFLRFRRKWIRKIRKTVHASVRSEVLFFDTDKDGPDNRTIIEVYAPDAYGLLYILCREISTFGLDISFAKIATRVDGVVDSFYVREAKGLPFTNASRRDRLRQTLLRHISELSHVE